MGAQKAMSLGKRHAEEATRLCTNNSAMVVASEKGTFVETSLVQGIPPRSEDDQGRERETSLCCVKDPGICEWGLGQKVGESSPSGLENSKELEVLLWYQKMEASKS